MKIIIYSRNLSYAFTFHYGPIQILNLSLLFKYCILFTFHYGPIQIEINTKLDAFAEEFTFHYGPIQIVSWR